MVFAPLAQYLPRATLAGILLVISYGLVDWKALAYHWRATKFDAAIVFATAFCAMAISVEFCVMVGVLMSFMLTVPRVGVRRQQPGVVAVGNDPAGRPAVSHPAMRRKTRARPGRPISSNW